MKKYDLSKIMKRAHEIKKENKNNIWSLCLKTAWNEAKNPVKEVVEEVIIPQFKSWFLDKNFDQNERYIINLAVIGDEMEILKKTEKAIRFRAHSDFGNFDFWCPKSCLLQNETEKEKIQRIERENRINAGLNYNELLVNFAKEHGIKGVRTGLKTKTLIQKIVAAGYKIPERV